MILLGSFQASPWIAAVSVTGVIFGAVYLLMATRKLLFGPLTHAENKNLSDINWREAGLMLPIVVLCFWIGVAPNPFLARTDASVDQLLSRIDAQRAKVALVEPPSSAPSTAAMMSAGETR
jgi:NADH-quinone oxidoreductase subunit M